MVFKTSISQNILRVTLGLIMIYIGIAHLSFRRIEFQAQVPRWLTSDESFVDMIVLISGYIEIIFGVLMVWGGKFKAKTGLVLGVFYVLVFPGNINQYIHEIDGLRMYSNNERFLRLLFQPVLIFWALWSTNALKFFKKN
jgi:uncharacterized membrane protein